MYHMHTAVNHRNTPPAHYNLCLSTATKHSLCLSLDMLAQPEGWVVLSNLWFRGWHGEAHLCDESFENRE
eukprot:9865144-Lingulodinium_polyedra.AAC.1